MNQHYNVELIMQVFFIGQRKNLIILNDGISEYSIFTQMSILHTSFDIILFLRCRIIS